MRKIYLFTFMMLLLAHLKGQAQQITLHVESAGTLSGMIEESRFPYIEELKLTGKLNGTDIRHIRKMIRSNLKILDLSEAGIVEGGGYYAILDSHPYYTSNDIIGENMFNLLDDEWEGNVSYISKIILPNSTLKIDPGAFKGCMFLRDINIPNSVTSIGSRAFSGCSSLREINIPNSVTSIGSSAFYGCFNLTEINIPNSVTSIREFTFSDCLSLTDINIPNSVTSIEWGAFEGCTSLTDINIPNSVTSIGDGTFYNCDNLKSVYLNSSNPPTIGNNAFPESGDLTIYIPRGSYTAYWLSYLGNYNLVEYDPTDIQGVTTSAHNGAEKYFSIDGRLLPGPCKGVNIIQDTDGKTRKAWIP